MRLLVVGLGLVLLIANNASGECVFADIACQNRFLDQNMPTIRRPENDPHDFALEQEVIRLIHKAADLSDREDAIKEEIQKAAGDTEAVALAQKRYADVQKDIYATYNLAIAKTIELYGLVPKITQPIAHDDLPDPDATKAWHPHYSEAEIFDENGHAVRGTTKSGATSRTDASIMIYRSAFDSPGRLAATIYHETAHWIDHALLGRKAMPYEDYWNEVYAYQKVIDAQNALGVPESDIAAAKAEKATYLRQALHTPINETWSRVSMKHPDYAPSSFVDASREPADPLDDVVSAAIKRSRAEAGKQKDQLHAIRDEELRETLRDIAFRACADPDSVDQAELNNLPVPYGKYALMRRPEGLNSDCSNRVYSYLSLNLTPAVSPDIATVRRVVAESVPAPLIPARQPASTPEVGADPLLDTWALAQLARTACASPQNLTQSDMSAVATNIEVRNPEKVAAALSGCSREVFLKIVQMVRSGEIQSDQALEAIRRAAMPPPPPPVNPPPIHHGEKDPPHDPCRRFYGDYCNG